MKFKLQYDVSIDIRNLLEYDVSIDIRNLLGYPNTEKVAAVGPKKRIKDLTYVPETEHSLNQQIIIICGF